MQRLAVWSIHCVAQVQQYNVSGIWALLMSIALFFLYILVCGIKDYARRGIAVLMSIVWVPKLKCNPLQK